MKESLSQQTANLKHKNNRHKRWKGIVSILACMVVFCTVYALILPALTAEGTLHCGKEEHTHIEDCYEKKLICGKEEGEGAHHHTDECYREEPVLVCTTPESDGHKHTDDCYTEEKVLTCTNTDPDHVHNDIDGCYTTERKLTCGKEEGEGAHHHTEECYETKRELICGQEENDGHKHTDDCYKKELVCGKEEHKHILACYSDPNADVEDGNVWQRTVSSVTLTGNWGADLAAIAKTQSGYTESTANYAVAEDGQTIHGYTRYGAWANDPYRDNWSAQFADFCLSYAGVPTSAVPQNNDCSAWNYTIPDGYTPKTGDLLLLDTDSNGSADHAGIVTSVSDSTLTAIVGDADKVVRNNTYNIGSETIKGYVSIPENPALATPTPEPTKEPEVTPEAQPTQAPEATPEVTEEPTQEPENKADDVADDKADENKTQDEDVKEDDGKKDDTANNIEVTPTPEVTETPETTPTPTKTPEDKEKKNEEIIDFTEISWCNVEKPEEENSIEDDKDTENEESIEEANFMLLSIEQDVSVMAANSGVDFGQYITKAVVKKIVNGEWKEATEFNDGDQIKTDIKYDIPAGILNADNRVISYQLPDGVLPQGDLNGVVYSKGSAVGTYTISSTGLIEITFNEDFVDNGSRIDGDVGFSGTVSSDNTKVDKDIIFGGKGGTIIIKKEEETPETGDINITKEGTLSEDKKTIEYKVKVSTVNGTKKTVTVKDYLKNATYNKKNVVIKDKDGKTVSGNVVYNETKAPAESSFEIRDLPELKAGEWYELTYSAAVGEGQADGTNIVENTASANDKSKWVQVRVSEPVIKKDGSYSEDTGKIKWTITVYGEGDSLDGYTLSDILDGKKLPDGYKATLNGEEIALPYTFGKGSDGKHTFEIVYETDAPDKAGNVNNKAELTKDGKGYSSDATVNVTKRDWDISKVSTGQEAVEGGKTRRFSWKSSITLPGNAINSLGKFTYEDTIKNGSLDSEHYGIKSELQQAIEKSINIKYLVNDNGQMRDQTDRLKDCSSWLSYTIIYKNAAGTVVKDDSDKVKSFIITFNADPNSDKKYAGKLIEFEYQTIGNIENIPVGETETFYNSGKLGDKEVTGNVSYKNPVRLIKQSGVEGSLTRPDEKWWNTAYQWNGAYSGEQKEAKLGEGKYIYYRILIDPEDRGTGPKTPIILTDTLPEGTEFVKGSGYALYSNAACNAVWRTNTDITDPEFSVGNGNVLTITLKENSYYLENDNKIAIYYAVKITDDTKLDGTGTATFTNKVVWGDREASTDTDIKKNHEVIEKTGSQRTEKDSQTGAEIRKDIVDYSIVINPNAEDLDDESDTLVLKDVLKDDARKLNAINLDLSTVKLYVYDATKEDKCGAEIDASRYVIEYNDSSSGKREFKVTLPDELACVLKYSYQYDRGTTAGDIPISNEAKLGSHTSKEDSFTLKESTSYANANKHIIVFKVDSRDFSKLLSGVKFELYKYENPNWRKVTDLTTNKNGRIDISLGDKEDSLVKHDVLYKLVETETQDGYEVSDKPYYIVSLENKTKDDIWNSISGEIQNGELGNNKDNIRTISQNGDTIYITNDYTSVGVEKKWLNSEGVAIKPGAESVTVKLQRETQTPTGNKVTVNCYDASGLKKTETVWIKSGTSMRIKWNMSTDESHFNFDLPGCTVKWESDKIDSWKKLPVIVTPEISSDVSINITYTAWWGNYGEGGSESNPIEVTYTPCGHSSSIDESYNPDQVILDASNNWKYVWKNLAQEDANGNPYYYKVVEVSNIPGYTVSYTNNDVQSGEVIVTNTRTTSQDYELPETGGIGTNRFTAVGMALMAGSLMCGYVMKRKRRERRKI